MFFLNIKKYILIQHKNVYFQKTSLFIIYKCQYLTDILAKQKFQIQKQGFFDFSCRDNSYIILETSNFVTSFETTSKCENRRTGLYGFSLKILLNSKNVDKFNLHITLYKFCIFKQQIKIIYLFFSLFFAKYILRHNNNIRFNVKKY